MANGLPVCDWFNLSLSQTCKLWPQPASSACFLFLIQLLCINSVQEAHYFQCQYCLKQQILTLMKACGYYSLVKTGECGLTKRLAFSLSPGICRCFGGNGKVLFTASESVVSEGKLTQISLWRWDTTPRGLQGWENIDPTYKFQIPYSGFVKIQCFN